MSTPITRKNASLISISILSFVGMAALSACSQKPSSEEIAAQVKVAMAEAETEKAKQEAAAAPAPAPVATPVAAAPKHVAQARPVAKPQPVQEARVQETPVPKAICANCGVVVSVKMIEEEGKGSGLGAIAGGLAGGVLGHQVGAGTGKDLATVAGAVGGAFAGNKLEKTIKKTKAYDITVRMENGAERVLRHTTEPGVAAGDKVKVENDLVVKQ